MDLVPNGHAVPGVQKAEGSLAPGSSPWHHHGILPSPPHLMPYLCPQSPHSIPWTLSQSSYGCRFPFLSVYITLHHVTSHYITLHHITLDYVTFRYIGYITLHTLHHIHRISTYLTFKRLVGHKPHTETKKVQAQWGRQFSLTQETGNLGVGWGVRGGIMEGKGDVQHRGLGQGVITLPFWINLHDYSRTPCTTHTTHPVSPFFR